MTRPTRKMIVVTAACAVVLGAAGGVGGRVNGTEQAPGLVVEPVEATARPKVGKALIIPDSVAIPAKAPK